MSFAAKLNPGTIDQFLEQVLPADIWEQLKGATASLAELEAQRQDAVKDARYEDAASLRDQIDSKILPPAGRAKNLMRELVKLSCTEQRGFDISKELQTAKDDLAHTGFDAESVWKAINTAISKGKGPTT